MSFSVSTLCNKLNFTTDISKKVIDAPLLVRFAHQEGYVFDRITFGQDFAVEDALMRTM